MSEATPQLLTRVQSAPIFLLSFRYRDELAALASAAGWRVIAARRGEAAEQRFIASGAIIAVVDLRGAGPSGLAAIAAIGEAAEANGAALLVLAGQGSLAKLESAMSAGATHVLAGPLTPARVSLALRSAERFALRMIATHGAAPQHADLWRDQQLGWEAEGDRMRLSPALAARLKRTAREIEVAELVALLPKEAQDPLAQAIALVAEHGRPSALTHRLSRTDPYPVAHHIRRDPVTQMLQGLIELPLTELGATAAAARDPLTGLGSASVARHALAVPNTVTQHVLLVGLARFEMINGAFGRMTGDAVLRALARRMTRALEAFSIPPPLAARIAGTTFLVLLAGDRAAGQVSLLAHDLAIALERPVIAEGHEVHVGCWIAAVERLADEDGPAVLRRASEALAEARASGASNIRLSKARGGPGQSIARPPSLPTELRTALDRNEIDILFQPQVAISTSEIVGVEALARWTHPVQGMLGAATLFAVAERSDYLGALSAHIQKRAAEQAARWPAALNRLRLSVNVTAQDIARSGFADGFLRMLDASGFPRDRLTLEITENGLIDNLAQAADLLAELRKAGCRVAIDDFGTGYSSLAYLKALPLDYLKIDKALAQDIIGTARDRVVVRGVIDMARSLGLAVIAEGVETEEQRAALAEQGANYYQGFLCAEPLDVLALETLVTSR